jgi:hypothetical protein
MGIPVKEFDDQPELFNDMIPFWQAFHELSTSRQMGMGLGYIPYSTIVDYLNEEQIFNINERDEYRQWIQTIDRIYVELQNVKTKESQELKRSKPSKTPAQRKPPNRR